MGENKEPVEIGSKTGCESCNCGGNCHKKHPFDLTEQEVLGIFLDSDALLTEGHFVYTSGRHGTSYVNKDLVYVNPDNVSLLCRAIAIRFKLQGIETVIAPATGGIALAQWTAFHLSEMTDREVKSVYAEKTSDGLFEIRRGYDRYVKFSNVLVVEDVLTTGASVKKVVDSVRLHDGLIVGVGAIWNRGNVYSKDLGVTILSSLVDWPFISWPEESCPLCKNGDFHIDTSVGKGREFLERMRLSLPISDKL